MLSCFLYFQISVTVIIQEDMSDIHRSSSWEIVKTDLIMSMWVALQKSH